MAEDLLDTVGQLFGTVRGGLAYAVVFVGALLAATTGVVAASVISMGLISLPIMLRYGYDRRVATGTIAASGTLAQIIPPSLVLIVLADQIGRSVDDMYKGAVLPGVGLAFLYALYVFVVSNIWRDSSPGLPPESIGYRKPDGARGLPSFYAVALISGFAGWWLTRDLPYAGIDWAVVAMAAGISTALALAFVNKIISLVSGRSFLSPLAERVTYVMVPPLLLIFLVLGTILIGLASPTEGGAMGAVGALILAAAKRRIDDSPTRFNITIVQQAAQTTAKLSAFVLFILIGARIFSLTFYGVNGHVWVEHLLTGLPGGMYGFLIFINIAVFFLAFFLDFFELAFIIVPLLKPVAETIFTNAPEAVAIAESLGMTIISTTDSNGVNASTDRGRDTFHDLVRRASRPQHADKLHASAIRFRALLLKKCRTARSLHRQDHRSDHRARHHQPDLLGCRAILVHSAVHGRRGSCISSLVMRSMPPRAATPQAQEAVTDPSSTSPTREKKPGRPRTATLSTHNPWRTATENNGTWRSDTRYVRSAKDRP